MKRYYCTHCKKKRIESKLVISKDRITGKNSRICKEHVSKLVDFSLIENTSEKRIFVELFSGSGNVSRLARSAGFDTVTIDIQEDYNPDIKIDILNLRRSALPENVYCVWASIPCTVYSILSISKHWIKNNIGFREYFYTPATKEAFQALKILSKTIKLIKQMNPVYYFIENPRGALRHMPHMEFVPYLKTVSYSDYGFKVYKPTDIFNNCKNFNPRQIKTAVNRKFETSICSLNNSFQRSLIPDELIKEVLCSIQTHKT